MTEEDDQTDGQDITVISYKGEDYARISDIADWMAGCGQLEMAATLVAHTGVDA